jgi:hypothetical protein
VEQLLAVEQAHLHLQEELMELETLEAAQAALEVLEAYLLVQLVVLGYSLLNI